MSSKDVDTIHWFDWSEEAFDKATNERKLVLLDLTASWCHWCHVMDSTTYSDPTVAKVISDNFVPVKVDIDKRPDIAERYHRGGFPTTAFLSDRGESIWGATYIPPRDMKRIIDTILSSKSRGEIDEALERVRANPVGLRPRKSAKGVPSDSDLRYLFDAVFATYDVEHGGFGVEPKFPHPDAVDLLLSKYADEGVDEFSGAVRSTIAGMARGLHDDVEGGVFRYSVSSDWNHPHYEKMLETNVEFLLNLSRAYVTLRNDWMSELAESVGEYLLSILRDPVAGGFFGSQDADQDYYRLGREARSRRRRPSIDKTLYAGWNGDAGAVFLESGILLGKESWVEAGTKCLDNVLHSLWSQQRKLVRHTKEQELFLFEDQVSLIRALITAMQQTSSGRYDNFARELIASVETNFAHPDGGFGDIISRGSGIGELGSPVRSLVANANWARLSALYGAIVEDRGLHEKAEHILGSFGVPEIEAHGVFASTYLLAADVIRKGPVRIDIHISSEKAAAESSLMPQLKRLVVRWAATRVVPDLSEGENEYAVVCGTSGCSAKMAEVNEVERYLKSRGPGHL